ncbi:MAG: hypothetical protein RLN76_01870 [Phycisphaeraceae bacterium]
MDGSSLWFAGLLGLSVMAWWGGVRLTRGRPWVAESVIVGSLVWLGVWAWLMHNPEVTLRIIPAGVLSFVEGVGSVPVFMLLAGAAFGRAAGWRQGGVTAAAGALGLVYLFYGGWWMLQSTPANAFGGFGRSAVVMQANDYSCVPAACTTTLRLLGVRASETEMAELTRTRPGRGATLVRAAAAMERKLAGKAGVSVVGLAQEQLGGVMMPAMTPLQFEAGRYHMVTLLEVSDRGGVWLLDPVDGLVYMSEGMFGLVYQGKVLVVDPPAGGMAQGARLRISGLIRQAAALAGGRDLSTGG